MRTFDSLVIDVVGVGDLDQAERLRRHDAHVVIADPGVIRRQRGAEPAS